MTLRTQAHVQLAGMLAITALTAAAFWAGEGPRAGLTSGALLLAVALFVHLGRRRSETLEALGGIGDERTVSLYARASAFAGNVLALVLPGWWLVTVAQGEPDETLSALCAVFAVAFLGACVVLPRRG